MTGCHSGGVSILTATEQIPLCLRNPGVRCRIHNSLLPRPSLDTDQPIPRRRILFFFINFNIIPRGLSFRFPYRNLTCISVSPHAFNMTLPLNLP